MNLLSEVFDMVITDTNDNSIMSVDNIDTIDSCSFMDNMVIEGYGCSHYLSRCKIVAPCCNESFSCRICHDEEKYYSNNDDPHEIDRYGIKRLICTNCELEQDLGQYCINCDICFGNYFCDKCLVIDDINKDQFHCDKCKICRTGGNENYKHCDDCNICINDDFKDDHVCMDTTDYDCPICLENISKSVGDIHAMKCGHYIHMDCFLDYLKTNYTCPLCSVSCIDTKIINEFYDKEIAETPMPEEYVDTKVDILCNDCHEESNVLFHVVALKCPSCMSYNTRQI